MKQLNYIDLFSGCGGLSLGFHNVNLKGLFSVEKSSDAFMTLRCNLIEQKNHFNWPQWLPLGVHDINELMNNYLPELRMLETKVDLIAGGLHVRGLAWPVCEIQLIIGMS